MHFETNPFILKIIGCGYGLLIFATVISYIFRHLKPQNQTFPKVLKIIGGWWIICALLTFSILLGQHGIVLLFLIASLLGLREYLSVQKLEFVRTPELAAMAVLTVAHYSFIILGWKNIFLFIVPLMSFIFLPYFFLARRKINGLIQNLWASQSALMLCVYFLSFVPGLVFLNDNPTAIRKIDPIAAFLFLFFTTELNDVFQFISGKLFGKLKLVAEISPNKTVAGFIGGLLCTSILSVIIAPIMLEINLWQSALLGFCISASGMSGDLMFSSLKRTYNVKDFSDLIPGHGGVLDRLDSMVFTAPTLYAGLYLFIHF